MIGKLLYKLLLLLLYNARFEHLKFKLLLFLGEERMYRLISYVSSLPIRARYRNFSNRDLTYKGVVMMFDGQCGQPGFADCLRGIASVYSICKKKNIPFKLVYKYPFKIRSYFDCNLYDWTIDDSLVVFEKSLSIPIVSMSYSSLFGEKIISIQRNYVEDMIERYRNQQIHIHSNICCCDDSFGDLFHELFKPKSNIISLVEYHLDKIGCPYISASFRFANLLGDIQDTYGEKMSDEEAEKLKVDCVKALLQLKTKHSDISKILVTSDSISFLDYALKTLDFIYVIPGEIGHLAHEGSDQVVLKSLLDMYMISRADFVYMVRTEKMYKSGFAQRAAMFENKPFEEYLIK